MPQGPISALPLSGTKFVIISLPRSGSTNLARVLNCHEQIRCLIEPFHPARYNGRFHAFALRESVESALDAIWTRWNGIKHVLESNGWPFPAQPRLNDEVVSGPKGRVIVLIRRNLLKRLVSSYMSRQTNYWIGPKEEFYARLDQVRLRPLKTALVRARIREDRNTVERLVEMLHERQVQTLSLWYEDLFGEFSASENCQRINSVLQFLEVPTVPDEVFAQRWQTFFDPSTQRWATPELYRRIPDIERIEEEVGSDATGWLFR